jgi:hypothetical protein
MDNKNKRKRVKKPEFSYNFITNQSPEQLEALVIKYVTNQFNKLMKKLKEYDPEVYYGLFLLSKPEREEIFNMIIDKILSFYR